jgi:hypothetical protein
MRQQAIQQQQTVNDDFETHLSSLEFEGGHHSVTVHRVEPEFDTNSGKRIAGYLAKFTRAVTFEEIRSQYGGGKYRFVVHGPGAFGKPTIKANKVYEIAGDPILPRSAAAAQSTQMLPDAVSDIVDKAISTHEKTADRLAVENRELTREMKQMLMATLNKGDGGLKDGMMQMITEERKLAEQRAADERRLQEQRVVEERRLQEQRLTAERQAAKETRDLLLSTMTKSEQSPQQLQSILMEERRLQEARMVSEREERRREQEASNRRHEQTLEMMRMQQEKQIEQMRIEQERVRSEARASEERARQQFELNLRQLEKQESHKETQAQKMTEFMSTLQNQQMQQMQAAQQMQLQQMQQFTSLERDFMLKQIDALSKKKEDTGIDQMLKFKQVFDTLTGKDEGGGGEQRETWEKIMDRINDSVPGIVAAAGLLRGSAPQAAAPQPVPQTRVLPGSIAVVDVDDEDDRVPMQRRNPRRRRRLQPPPQARTISPSVQTAPAVASPVREAVEAINDFTDFVFPQEDTPVEHSLEMIVKDIDLAIQRELSAREIDDQVIKKFPPTVAALVANTDVDTLLGVLEARSPSSWRINSLDGQQKVRELHALLAKAG